MLKIFCVKNFCCAKFSYSVRYTKHFQNVSYYYAENMEAYDKPVVFEVCSCCCAILTSITTDLITLLRSISSIPEQPSLTNVQRKQMAHARLETVTIMLFVVK